MIKNEEGILNSKYSKERLTSSKSQGEEYVYTEFVMNHQEDYDLQFDISIKINLSIFDNIERVFNINPAWDYGRNTLEQFKVEQGLEGLQHFVSKFLIKRESHNISHEVLFNDDSIPVRFFDNVFVTEVDKPILIGRLNSEGIYKINGVPLDKFIQIKNMYNHNNYY